MRGRRPLAGGAVQVALAICGVVFVAPYVLMLCSSFRTSDAIRKSPDRPLRGRLVACRTTGRSSTRTTSWGCTSTRWSSRRGSCSRSSCSAFPRRSRSVTCARRGSRVAKALIIATLSIPIQAIGVTNYLTIAHLGLVDTRRALVLPFLASAFGVYLLCEYAESVPKSQIDAARMLDLGIVSRLRNMVLPHMRPAILAFGAFAFVGWWNEFFWPFIVISTPGQTNRALLHPGLHRGTQEASPTGAP